MKKKVTLILSMFTVLFMVACGESAEDDTNNPTLGALSDTLVYSLDRLSQVDLNVNLNALTGETPQNVSNKSDDALLNASSDSVDIDTEVDTLTYTDIPNSSNIGLEFRNLNTGIQQFAEQSKGEVDWALENITVEDTWVTYDDSKLSLSYDEANDIVTLSSANADYVNSDDETYFLRQIAVYYNDLGQLVVDVYDAYKGTFDGNPFASFGRLTYIKDTLYEWSSDIWANGVKEEMPMAGGPGWFKAYISETTGLWTYLRGGIANISYNVQTPNGWIQTLIRVAEFDDVANDTAVFDYVKVGTKNLENDVFSFNFNDEDETVFRFFPAAYNGWTNITATYSEAELKNLQDWNPDLYEDVDLYDSMNASMTYDNGYEETDETKATVMVSASNIDDLNGDYYVDYVAEATTSLSANYLNMLPLIKARFETYGLTYKHGNLDQLFNETIETILNLERLFNQFELNGTRGFVDIELFRSVLEDEMTMLHGLADRYDEAFGNFDTMDYTELPQLSLDSISFIDFSEQVTGSVSFDPTTETLATQNVSFSLEPSLLLQENQTYTIVYGLYTNQAFVYIGEEAGVTFTGETLNITGNQSVSGDTNLLQEARYVLVGYLARVTEDGHVRISTVSPMSVDAFEDTVLNNTVEGIETTLSYTFDSGLFLDVSKTDNLAPTVIINDVRFGDTELTFTGDDISNTVSVSFDNTTTLQNVLENIEFLDNSQEAVIFGVDALTFNGAVVTEFDANIQAGTYVITVSDTSGNVTILTINTTITTE